MHPPNLAYGAHQTPMRDGAVLSLRGQLQILVEFLDRLELRDGTLAFIDWCGAQVLITENWDERVGRIVFASCGTYHNYPPGLPRGAREIAQFVSGTVPTELGQ